MNALARLKGTGAAVVVLVASFMMVFSLSDVALALEPPTDEQIAQYKQDGTIDRRLKNAKLLGNDKTHPSLVYELDKKLEKVKKPKDTKGPDAPVPTPPGSPSMPSSGTVKVLSLLVSFPEYAPSNAQTEFAAKLFGDGDGNYPYESLRNYYLRSSYGQLSITGNPLGWYQTAYSRSSLGTSFLAAEDVIKEALAYYDAQGHDFSQYDNNGDGVIDYLVVFWTGPDSGWSTLWWGWAWGFHDPSFVLDGKTLGSYSWQWEANPYPGDFTTNTVIHETGHALGLPDLYDYNGNVGPDGGVGGYDMMDAAIGDHNAFSKYLLDWIVPSYQVSEGSATYSLASSGTNQDALLVMPALSDYTFDEFFMVQNRHPVGNDTAWSGWGIDGTAVWHIDSHLNGSGTGFLFDNSYTDHKLVRLMEADGWEEIEQNFWVDAGDMYLSGDYLSPWTAPSSQTYGGLSSGVTLDLFSNAGTSTSFRATIESGLSADSYEPDDTWSDAVTQAVNGPTTAHSLYPVGDEDWIRIDTVPGWSYTVQTFPSDATSTDTVIEVYDSALQLVASNDDIGGDPYSFFSLVQYVAQDSVHFVKIRGWDGFSTVGNYLVGVFGVGGAISGRVTDVSSGSGLAGFRVDAYDTLGNIDSLVTDGAGYYSFDGLAPGSYKLRSWNDAGYVDEWYDDHLVAGDSSGYYATWVDNSTADAGGIDFALELGDIYEPNNDSASATAQAPNAGPTFRYLHDGDEDWVYFDSVVGHTYLVFTATVDGSWTDTWLEVFDSDLTFMGSGIGGNDDSGGTLFSRFEFTAADSLSYVKVRGWIGTSVGRYRLFIADLSAPLSPPETYLHSYPPFVGPTWGLGGWASDDVGLFGVESSLDGGVSWWPASWFWTEPGSETAQFYLQWSGLTDGAHTLMVRALDDLGQPDPTPVAHTMIVDSVQPVLTWDTPVDGAVMSGPVGFSGSVADATAGAKVVRCSVYDYSGGVQGPQVAYAEWSPTGDTDVFDFIYPDSSSWSGSLDLPAGEYLVLLSALDGAWNRADALWRTITVLPADVPTPAVSFPNGGETVHLEEATTIEWDVDPAANEGDFRVWVYDDRNWWEVTQTSVPVVPGEMSYSLPWTPAEPIGSGYRVRVWYRDGVGNWISFDDSDATFTIGPALKPVTVTAPNGWETATTGVTQEITWTLNDPVIGGDFRIWVFDSVSWYEVTSSPVPRMPGEVDYSFSWAVSEPPGGNYKVRVWLRDDGGNWLGFDDSDHSFTIAGPALTMTAPAGPTGLTQGQPAPVSFSVAPGLDEGAFYLWAYDARDWHLITPSGIPVVPGQTEYDFDWRVGPPPGSGYRICAWYRTVGGNWTATDETDQDFTIVAPEVTLTDPDGGEALTWGDEVAVNFSVGSGLEEGSFRIWAYTAGQWYEITSAEIPVEPGLTSYVFPWTVAQPGGQTTACVSGSVTPPATGSRSTIPRRPSASPHRPSL